MKDLDVLAIGELNPDLILSDIHAEGPVLGTEQLFDTEKLTLGSSTAIACVLMQRLGLATGFAGLIGEDDHGRFCRAALADAGIELSGLVTSSEVETGITISVSYAGDRLLLTRAGAMATFAADMVAADLLARARHVHVGSFFLQHGLRPGLADLFRQAKAQGCSLSLDPGWDPTEAWDPAALRAVLPLLDVFLPNRDEAMAMTGAADLPAALDALHDMGATEIAVKLGREGGGVSLAGAGFTTAPGHVVEVLDTTGAGDSFNAGYLAARLSGRSIAERLRLANACGALTAGAIGGTNGVTDRAAALAMAGLGA